LAGADQVSKIAASMAEFGWTVPCLVAEDGELIAGHGRALAATQLGLTEAPVIVLGHLTEAQRRAYRIADNKLTELGTWDEALLSAELNDLLAEDFDLSLVGFSDGELDKLLAYVAEDDGEEGGAGGSVPPVTIPEPPRNPASRTGDLWNLGDHRLLCGDSTSAADVRRLMNGERAILFATDPPYLVDYDGSNHPTRNKDWSASYGTTWDDSSQGAELYDGFIAAAVAEAIAEDAAWYFWHASYPIGQDGARRPYGGRLPVARSAASYNQPLGRAGADRASSRHPAFQRSAPRDRRRQRAHAGTDAAMAGKRRHRRAQGLQGRPAACRIHADPIGQGSCGQGTRPGRLDRNQPSRHRKQMVRNAGRGVKHHRRVRFPRVLSSFCRAETIAAAPIML
jgi:ParB-like chromosome segregation protein Spo0J